MRPSLLSAFSVTFLFFSLGFYLLHHAFIGYGITFFILIPAVLGFLMGVHAKDRRSWGGFALATVVFGLFLLAFQLEGVLCLLMALPLILASAGVGALLSWWWRRRSGHDERHLSASVLPVIGLLLFGWWETVFFQTPAVLNAVSTETVLPHPPIAVYNAIKSVDTLIAPPGFLMHLDLPVPRKCVLEQEAVGGIRTCYFDGGQIVERITALQPGVLLRMEIVDYQLTGRKWLGFQDAVYTFEALPNGHTRLRRSTTYRSELYPRLYWQPLETMGIAEEHAYILDHLHRDLPQNASR